MSITSTPMLGQDIDSLTTSSSVESYRLLIPKLEVLIDSALANNGMLGYRKNEIEVKKANLKSKRRNWTRNFGIQADTRYGTFDNFSNNVSGPNTVTLASTTTQTNYGVGLYLKIPVFDIFNRKSDIKQAKAEISQAESLVKFQEDEIRETVIRYYEDLILKENLLEIQAINLSDAKVNKEMAKKEFTNGQLEIYEYIRISDITAGVATEFEKAKSNLLLAKKLLENFTGVQIN
ncbi:MAG: TolC family protein [Bacteroidota bacterium]